MKIVFACLLAITGVLQATSVYAERWSNRSFDYHLLRSDAVMFGTIEELNSDGLGTTSVKLTDLNIVSSRWALGAKLELTARGTAEDSRLKAVQHQPELERGSRYLFFLRGGEYDLLPIIGGVQAIYKLDEASIVQCAGGQIYGVGPRKLNCSVPDRQVGQPLNEKALAAQLRTAVASARLRKPTFAQEEDNARRQLQPSPKDRP